MTVVGLISPKHSPGTTTSAVALALAVGEGAVVIEADPAGGDVAPRGGLPVEPGLLTMAASARHNGSALSLHAQRLPSDVEVVVTPTRPDQSAAALSAIADRLGTGARSRDAAFIDCGRWSPMTVTATVLASCDVIVMVTDPTVAGIEHTRCRLDAVTAIGPTVVVLLVGDRPYGVADVEEVLGVPVIGSLAVDPRGAVAVYAGPPRAARKSALCRSARSALERLAELTPRPEVRA